METPVLLLAYNRPTQTEQVLQRLKECGVTTVFVSADGPKNASDRISTDEVKSLINRYGSIIADSRFSDRNQGCKKAVIEGINWFFDNVDEGIILEDDCLPSEYFFPFMNDMLNRYREAEKIWMISGNNLLGTWESEGGHFFSRIGHIWGWATWKDSWDDFRPELPYIQSFIDDNGFEKAFGPTKLAESRKQLTLQSKRGEIDTWDYQWMAQILTENGLAVIPSQNLVENIGFTDEGTNVTEKPNWITNEITQAAKQTDLSYPSIANSIDGGSPFAKGVSRNETGDFARFNNKESFQTDREYEMELELCKRSNTIANRSAFHFSELGKAADRKLKLVLINSTDVGGGAEKLTFELHQELLGRGYDSTLLVQHKKSDLNSTLELTSNPLEQIRQLRPDVLHVHNLHGTCLQLEEVAILSKAIPILFTLHDSWLTTGSKNHPFELESAALSFLEMREWKNELEQRQAAVLSSTIRFTVPSQWLRERFFDAYRIKAYSVPNGIKKTAPSAVDIPSNRYILFVANNAINNPYKDFRTLKKAWAKANKSLEKNGVDLVCASGVPCTETIGDRRFIVLPKLKNEEVLGLMANALFVVQASRQDNAPLAILEAHSVGKSVIGSLVGGIPEMLSEEIELCWLYESENAMDMAKKMVKAITSENGEKTNLQPTFKSIVQTYVGHYVSMSKKKSL